MLIWKCRYTAASLIPGVDTFADLASVPVDLLRGDYVGAGLSAVGVIPVIGEVADAAKAARIADNAADAVKAVDRAIDAVKTADAAGDAIKAGKVVNDFSIYPKTIHMGRQGKHIIGHNNYEKGKSILTLSKERAQKLINKFSGTGKLNGTSREVVDFGEVIGEYISPRTGKSYPTTVGKIHYSKKGTHIVPEKPIGWEE